MPATIAVAPIQVTAGTTDTQATFTATLDGAATSPVTLTYSTSNGTARAGRDYTATQSSVTIPAGSTSATFTVPVTADTVAGKANERFYLNLKASAGNTVATKRVAATIVDGVAQPVVTASDLTITEPTSANQSKTGSVTISLTNPSARAVRVSYSTVDGTAVAAGTSREYVARSGSVTIRAGATSVKLPVRVYGRATSDEFFNVTLRSATGATLSTVRPGGVYGRVVVQDSATTTRPTATVSSPTVTTGDAAIFNVTLSSAATAPVSFRYSTTAGTTASGDITPVNSILTIPAGQTTGTIVVQTVANSTLTAPETFNLNLSAPANATLASSSVTATINPTASTTPTPTATVSVANGSATVGATGTANLSFVVSLNAASTTPVTVTYFTVDNTAVAGTDYVAATGTLTFAPGQTTQTVNVTVNGETSATASKNFTFVATVPRVGTAPNANATGTINYTSTTGGTPPTTTTPTVTLAPGTVSVGGTGSAVLPFTLTLSAAATTPVTVNYKTFDGTAVAGLDYTATSGTVTIPAGSTTATVDVPVNGEITSATSKTVGLSLTSATNATLTNTATGGTVTYTVQPTSTVGPGITLQGGSATVGSTGTAELPFTVTLSQAATLPVLVTYTTLDRSAVAGTDYTATSGTLYFAPGVTSLTVNVPVTGETSTATSKTLALELTDAYNATINQNTSTGTITYSSSTATPEVDVNSPSVVVTAGTPTTVTFNVILSSKSANTVTATYTTADGTAVAGTDYTASTGTLTFAAGVDQQTVTVTLLGAASTVTSKTFSLNITGTTNASNTTGTGTATLNYTVTGTPNVVTNNLTNTTAGVDTSTGTTYNAASFTTTKASTLNSATLLLDSADSGVAQVGVFTDDGGIPGTLVGFLSSSGTLTSTATATTFTSTDGLALSANSTYWIVLVATTGSVDWSYTTEDTGAGAGFTDSWAQTSDSGSDWFAYNSSPVQMSVTVTPGS